MERIKARLISFLLVAVLMFSFAAESIVLAQEEYSSNYDNEFFDIYYDKYFPRQEHDDTFSEYGDLGKVDNGIMYDIECLCLFEECDCIPLFCLCELGLCVCYLYSQYYNRYEPYCECEYEICVCEAVLCYCDEYYCICVLIAPQGISMFFRTRGVGTTTFNMPESVDNLIRGSTVSILTYATGSGAHTVAVYYDRETGMFRVFNDRCEHLSTPRDENRNPIGFGATSSVDEWMQYIADDFTFPFDQLPTPVLTLTTLH